MLELLGKYCLEGGSLPHKVSWKRECKHSVFLCFSEKTAQSLGIDLWETKEMMGLGPYCSRCWDYW